MSESSLSVEAQVIGIDPYEKDSHLDPERMGHVDVLYRLVRPREDGGNAVLATAKVRVYFKRDDISLNAIIPSALSRGHEALSQIVEHYKPAPSDVNSDQLWQK